MISRIKEILSSCVKRSGSSTAPSAVKQMNQFSKKNNEGLFGLVVALMTFGLERLLNEEIFKCPKSGYKMYGIAFFVVPGIILLLINLLTVPASGNVRIWTLCESCLVGAYYRYGDFTSGFLSALCVGFVAPSAWVFLALFNGRHLVCWELGYQLNDKISAAYLHERGLQHLNVSEYKQMVYDAKSKSQACGAIFLAIAVVCLGLFIILRRSMLKPFDSKQRLPGLCDFEKREALAASNELRRLLKEQVEDDDIAGMASLAAVMYSHKRLAVTEHIRALEERKKGFIEGDERIEETELEIAEFQELETALSSWNDYQNLLHKQKTGESSPEVDEQIVTAKQKYEITMEKRQEKITHARSKLDEYKKNLETCSSADERKVELDKIMHQTRLLDRLLVQNEHFAMDELLQRWEFSKDDQEKLKVLSANLLSHIEEGLTDTPELRGKIVAAYIIHLYREKNPHFLHAEQILDKFKSIYPRAATSKPSKRYVNVEDVMYKHIFEKYRNSEAVEKGVPATHLVVQDAEWSEEDEKMWQAAVRRKNLSSGTWWTLCCTRGYNELTNERGEDAANGEGMELEVVQVRKEEPEEGRSEENQRRGGSRKDSPDFRNYSSFT